MKYLIILLLIISFSFSTNQDFERKWQKVNALEKKGLSRSALEEVNKIYDIAEAENNAVQQIKAIFYIYKYKSIIEEDSFISFVNFLKEKIKKEEKNVNSIAFKSILYSVLAESYWKYYKANRYKIFKRSYIAKNNDDDFTKWDIKKFVNEIKTLYLKSLENADLLKKTKIDDFSYILIGDKSSSTNRKYRPTLYDFLAHRALNYFKNDEHSIVMPSKHLEFNNETLFSASKTFYNSINSTIDTQNINSLSLKECALYILADLINFHYENKNLPAYFDVENERFDFVYENSSIYNKDSLYLSGLENIAKQFDKNPEITRIWYLIANFHYNLGNKYNYKDKNSFKYKYEKKIAKNICDSILKKFPDTDFSVNLKNLSKNIKEKYLSFKIENVSPPGTPILFKIYFKNIKKLYLKLIQIKPEYFTEERLLYNKNNALQYFSKMKEIKKWEVKLPAVQDYQQHSTELALSPLSTGIYSLIISPYPDFSDSLLSFSTFIISNISYLSKRNKDGSIEFFVADRKKGTPMKDVVAQIFYRKYDYITRKYVYKKAEVYVTDKSGRFIIKPLYNNIRSSFFIEFKYGDDYLNTFDSYYQYSFYNNNKPTIKCYFFTDRAIYRPGQTVYFKGILIEKNGKENKVVTNKDINVALFDANNQKISELNLISNDYGSVNGYFILPKYILPGNFKLKSQFGSLFFRVEEYKRPKFEVNFIPIKKEYSFNDTITVIGKAISYSGAPLDNAKVKFSVKRKVFIPYTWFREQNYSPVQIAYGESQTKKDGTFIVKFIAKPGNILNKKDKPVFIFSISADVIDINGESHSAQTSIAVSYYPYLLSDDIPDKINSSKQDTFYINVKNLNNESVKANLKIELYKLTSPSNIYFNRKWNKPDLQVLSKNEFISLFHNIAYTNEDEPQHWEKNKIMEETVNTSKYLFISKIFSKYGSAKYLLKININDSLYKEKYFEVFSENDKTLAIRTPLWISAIKNNCEPGENAEFLFGTSLKNLLIFVEVEHNNEIIKKFEFKLNNEIKKLEIPVEEKFRGGFIIHFYCIYNNRAYVKKERVNVPYSNKQLKIDFITFRNKVLPGNKEIWKLKISGNKGEKVAAELLTAMYDASLDFFKKNNWILDIYHNYYSSIYWSESNNYSTISAKVLRKWQHYEKNFSINYEKLNWFGYSDFAYGNGGYYPMAKAAIVSENYESENELRSGVLDNKKIAEEYDNHSEKDSENTDLKQEKKVKVANIRKDFNETAFFYPGLHTNDKGEVEISFTLPDALTKWKFLALAHSKDLKIGQLVKEIIAQKDLMIIPNNPRFLRENDNIVFSSKINNLSDAQIKATVKIEFFDALTMKNISKELLKENSNTKKIKLPSKQSTSISWNIAIPNGISALTYRISASSSKHTDAIENTLPVLSNRILVTESMPMNVIGKGEKKYHFNSLDKIKQSSTLKPYKLTLEFCSNPVWYVVQSLPYLIDNSYDCSEQIFSKFYANALSNYIINSFPKIKTVLDLWKEKSNGNKNAFLSSLEKNQELKNALLEETPWVLEAKKESEEKKNIALLFDINNMKYKLESSLQKLIELQSPNGGWPWFKGMPDNRYITQYIVSGIGHLNKLGVDISNLKNSNTIKKAVLYLDDRIREDYEKLITNPNVLIKEMHINSLQIQYLYARSFFTDIEIKKTNKAAFYYFLNQAKNYWLNQSKQLQAMIALALFRFEDKNTAKNILSSLKENAIYDDEMGMYWKEIRQSYRWYDFPVESQAILIEAFDEILNDKKSVDKMKIWLLKQKQTHHWHSTTATANACYAILLKGEDWLQTTPKVSIKINSIKNPDFQYETGTAYFKKIWNEQEISDKLSDITIKKENNGISWGAVYFQYFEDMRKITDNSKIFSLTKKLYIEKTGKEGEYLEEINENNQIKIGDKIVVRITMKIDRDMEFLHLKDMHAAGLEPLDTWSGYRFQDGLEYYLAVKDLSTSFFFDKVYRGSYVLEYKLIANVQGNFSNGIATLQCMYAPEFNSHTKGTSIIISK